MSVNFVTDRRPDAADLAFWQTNFNQANELLWDAFDEQVYIASIDFDYQSINDSLSDIFIDECVPNGAGSASLTLPGGHITLRSHRDIQGVPCLDSVRVSAPHDAVDMRFTIAHEIGHYVFGLRDEYQRKVPPSHLMCASFTSAEREFGGECFELYSQDPSCNYQRTGDVQTTQVDPETHNCIMQNGTRIFVDSHGNASSIVATELCTHHTHDHDVSCEDCPAGPTQRRTWQTIEGLGSCWSIATSRFPSLNEPAIPSSGVAGPPPAITFIDRTTWTNRLSLLVDTSGSMGTSKDGHLIEVCANGFDDDSDGMVDEIHGCTDDRLGAAKLGIGTWLADRSLLAGVRETELAISSFDTNPISALGLTLLNPPSRDQSILPAVQALAVTPAGSTNMGDGLDFAHQATIPPPQGPQERHRGVVMFTDGQWNQGSDPIPVADTLRAQDVSILALATWEAMLSMDVIQDLNGGGTCFADRLCA